MSETPSSQAPLTSSELSATAGLRLRLWLACLAGPLVSGAALWWVLGALVQPNAFQPSNLLIGVAAATGVGLLVAAACALWLDHAIVGQLRGLLLGLSTGRITELRDLPAATGWGELSVLTGRIHGIATRQRQLSRSSEELESLRRQLETLRERVERWNRTERWEALPSASGPMAPVAEGLNRGIGRLEEVREQNREAARQILVGMEQALAEAQESAEQAERGFVEATALLTTVRELQRLAGELTLAMGAPVGTPAGSSAPSESSERYRAVARAAIEELVTASSESVESLGRGLMQVQEIADQVQVLANRATLIAINAVSAGSRAEPSETRSDLADDLKTLAREVRGATDRTTRLALAVEGEVASATERMRTTRAHLAASLESAPAEAAAPGEAAERPAAGDAVRLLERVREMIQDAASKGERLSAAGERTSRSAERLARRLQEDAQELEGLAVRLEPVGAERSSGLREGEAARSAAPPARMGLRLLGEENLLLDEDTSSAGNGEGG